MLFRSYPVAFKKIEDLHKSKKINNNYFNQFFVKKIIEPVNCEFLSSIFCKKWSNDITNEQKQAVEKMNLVLKEIINKKKHIDDCTHKMLKL